VYNPDRSHNEAAGILKAAGRIIALTGAGASTESGIPDFRSRNGLWSRFDPMEYGTLGAFRLDPVKVWTMLAELLSIIDAMPNEGHRAMACMEGTGRLIGIITQNIDGLHQKAGSKNVVEFHGSMASFSCPACQSRYPVAQVRAMQLPPLCRCSAILKPEVVFFDEAIPDRALTMTENLIREADVLIVAGTSCQVVPASLIPSWFKQKGGKIIEINREPVLTGLADVCLVGEFSVTMSRLAASLEQE